MSKRQDLVSYIDSVYDKHVNYWQHREPDLCLYSALYSKTYWENQDSIGATQHVETDEGYNTVESMLAQVYFKDPGVVLQEDITSVEGDAPLMQQVINRWLPQVADPIKQASRWALIYPFAGVKLVYNDKGEDPTFDTAEVIPLQPWNMLIDFEASNPRDASYIGHVKELTVFEAKQIYGNKKFLGNAPDNILNEQEKPADLPDEYKVVKIIEFYDLLKGKVTHLVPPGYIDRTDRVLLHEDIPYKTSTGACMAPVVQVILGHHGSRPLQGSSLIGRMSDALVAKNWLLTMFMHRAKQDAPKYLVSNRLGDQVYNQLTDGILDTYIPVEAQAIMDNMIYKVDSGTNPSTWRDALSLVDTSIERSISLPAFARGEATKATATEVLELQSYASSMTGMSAEGIAKLIVNLAKLYQGFLSVIYDEQDPTVLRVDGQPTILFESVIEAKYRITPVESIASPLGGAIERRNLLSVYQSLATSPVIDQKKLMELLLKVYDLPADLMAEVPAEPGVETPDDQPGKVPTEAAMRQLGPNTIARGFND